MVAPRRAATSSPRPATFVWTPLPPALVSTVNHQSGPGRTYSDGPLDQGTITAGAPATVSSFAPSFRSRPEKKSSAPLWEEGTTFTSRLAAARSKSPLW